MYFPSENLGEKIMAKIAVSFDTVEKTMKVTIDGKAIDNVSCASFYCNSYEPGEEFRCQIQTMMKDEDNDMNSYTNLMASAQEPELKEVSVVSKTQADIAAFLSRK